MYLKELRKKHGLTQPELAKKCGLNIRTYQRIENHETDPTIKELYKILCALPQFDINKYIESSKGSFTFDINNPMYNIILYSIPRNIKSYHIEQNSNSIIITINTEEQND